MRIGFFINNIETEKAGYTTLHLAMTAVNRGHEVWIIGAGDLAGGWLQIYWIDIRR